jgi:hypothetical protein
VHAFRPQSLSFYSGKFQHRYFAVPQSSSGCRVLVLPCTSHLIAASRACWTPEPKPHVRIIPNPANLASKMLHIASPGFYNVFYNSDHVPWNFDLIVSAFRTPHHCSKCRDVMYLVCYACIAAETKQFVPSLLAPFERWAG